MSLSVSCSCPSRALLNRYQYFVGPSTSRFAGRDSDWTAKVEALDAVPVSIPGQLPDEGPRFAVEEDRLFRLGRLLALGLSFVSLFRGRISTGLPLDLRRRLSTLIVDAAVAA